MESKVKHIPLKGDKETSFDYWIKLSTLEQGKKIYLPVTTNRYFERIDGTIKILFK